MLLTVKKVPIKVYNSIKKVEWYYILLYHIYKIIFLELKGISEKLTLQIAIKAINDSAGLDGLVLILLIFSTYF